MPTPSGSSRAVPIHDPRKRLGALIAKLLDDAKPRLSGKEIVRQSRAPQYPANLSDASLSRMRAGTQLPTPEVLDTLLAVLGVSPEVRCQARWLWDLAANPLAHLDHDHVDREDSTAHESHPQPRPQPAESPGGVPAIEGRPPRTDTFD